MENNKKKLSLPLKETKNKCQSCDGIKKKEERPVGKVKIVASGGMFYLGRDQNGTTWESWRHGPWEKKSKEEKKE